MKQIFTALMVVVFAGNAYAQVITQNQVPNTVQNGSSVACTIAPNDASSTRANSYIRAFRLQDFGINTSFNITNIAFGVQSASRNFPVSVRLHRLNGSFPGGGLALLDNADVNVSPVNNLQMVNTGSNINGVIPAGGSFVVEVFHNGFVTNPRQAFFMGSHPGGQMQPSYLIAPACNMNNPTPTGTGPLTNFPQARWVMTVTGTSGNLGITEVINSPDLQIFPNPVKDILKFRFSNGLKSESIEIFDMSGKAVTSIQNSKNVNEVNMSSYTKGSYILKVKANDGKLYVDKIIKE